MKKVTTPPSLAYTHIAANVYCCVPVAVTRSSSSWSGSEAPEEAKCMYGRACTGFILYKVYHNILIELLMFQHVCVVVLLTIMASLLFFICQLTITWFGVCVLVCNNNTRQT